MKLDKVFWNVVSIREPQVPRPDSLLYAKRYHEVICEDREEVDPDVPSRSPRVEDAEFVRDLLMKTPAIRPQIRAALQMEKPSTVFWSVLQNGKLALLNFSSRPARVTLASRKTVEIPSYDMVME